MHRLIAFALAFAFPAALASGLPPPAGADRFDVAGIEIASWAGEVEAANATLEPGSADRLWLAVEKYANPRNATSRTYFLNVTSDTLGLFDGGIVVEVSFEPATSDVYRFADLPYRLAANATGTASWTVNATILETVGNETTVLGSGERTFTVAILAPAPPAGLPTSWLVGGALAVLVLAGAGAFAARSRAQRRKMRGATRSQALREIELEEATRKRPAEAAVVQQELREQEKVREKSRDLQILEAKRADALKSMELLKKRHESGGLTKLQYDNMVAKKRADLERIEAEIVAMER